MSSQKSRHQFQQQTRVRGLKTESVECTAQRQGWMIQQHFWKKRRGSNDTTIVGRIQSKTFTFCYYASDTQTDETDLACLSPAGEFIIKLLEWVEQRRNLSRALYCSSTLFSINHFLFPFLQKLTQKESFHYVEDCRLLWSARYMSLLPSFRRTITWLFLKTM